MSEQTLEPRLERDLRIVLDELAPSETPPSLRSFVATVAEREAVVRGPRQLGRQFFAFAAATVAVGGFIAVLAIGLGVINGLPIGPGQPAGTATAGQSPSPSPSSSPSVVHRSLTFRLVPADGHAPTVAELQADTNVLLDRVSLYGGSSGAGFQGAGADRIDVEVDVPVNDPGMLERVAATLAAPGAVRLVPLGSDGQGPGQTIDPALPPLLSGDAIEEAAVGSDQSGVPVLDIVLSPAAAETFATWSAAHVGSQFAITLDGTIEAAPIVQSPVTDGHLRIGPDTTGSEAIVRLAAVLRSGPLPVPVALVASQP